MRKLGFVGATAAIALSICSVAAQAQGDRPGRFTMSPAEGGGFIRLDTETGQMSLCQRRESEWSCREVAEPGRGLDQEIERLRAENQRLRTELRQMEDIMLGERQAESRRAESRRAEGRRAEGPRGGGGGMELRLPTEQDLDNAMSYVQRMLRKFRDKMKELEAESKGTPL